MQADTDIRHKASKAFKAKRISNESGEKFSGPTRGGRRRTIDNLIGGRQALITVGKTFLQGGIPIMYKGEVIGGVGVSGASSAQQDEEVAIAGSKAKFD